MGPGYDGWDGMHDGAWSAGWMVVMMIIFVVVIALAVWAVIALTRGNRGSGSAHLPPSAPPTGTTAQEILDRRLANGEIEVDEYQRRSEALRGQLGSGSAGPGAST